MELKVNELFTSLQGEGPRIGSPAVFIRLQGCNRRCSFCDTQHSQSISPEAGRVISIGDFQSFIRNYPLPLVVITGGEPFHQSEALAEYIWAVREDLLDRTIQFETNGDTIPTRIGRIDHAFRMQAFPIELEYVVSPKDGIIDNMEIVREWVLYDPDVVFKFVVSTADEVLSYLENLRNIQSAGKINVVFMGKDNVLAPLNYMSMVNPVLFAKNYTNLNLRFLPRLHKILDIQ